MKARVSSGLRSAALATAKRHTLIPKRRDRFSSRQPPAADPRAVFEYGLDQRAAQARQRRRAEIVEPALRDVVALQNRALAATLEIDVNVDRDARAAGPLRIRRFGAVADEITVVGHQTLRAVAGTSLHSKSRLW